MINEEDQIKSLYLAYLVSMLYVETAASTRAIAEVTDIPPASIKRYIKMPSKKRDAYLKLMSGVIPEKQLDSLISNIEETTEKNKQEARERKTIVNRLYDRSEEIEAIRKAYRDAVHTKTEDQKDAVRNLRITGESYRKISAETGISPSHAYKIAKMAHDTSANQGLGIVVDTIDVEGNGKGSLKK